MTYYSQSLKKTREVLTVAYQCDICGKRKQYGHNVSFSQRKTQKIWKPNLQTKRIQLGSNKTKVKMCTQCIRSVKREKAKATA